MRAPDCNKRFEKLGIPQTVEARRAYRELIVTTPGLADRLAVQSFSTKPFASRRATEPPLSKSSLSRYHSWYQGGHRSQGSGRPSGEKVTEGLDGLRDRLQEYFQMARALAKCAR